MANKQPKYRSVLTLRATPGNREDLLQLYADLDILGRALARPGAIDMTLAVALEDPDGILITATWDAPESYQAWLDHPERTGMTDAIAPLLAEPPRAATYRIADTLSKEG